MGRLEDRINAIKQITRERPELRKPLELHTMILEAQRQIRESPGKGTSLDWNDKPLISNLQSDAIKSNKPIAGLLDASVFDSILLLQTCEKVAGIFFEKGAKEEELKELIHEMKSGRINIQDAVSAVLKGDAEPFGSYGEKFGIDPALIFFIISSLIQPCIEEIADKTDSSLKEKWWQSQCPVCGRVPMCARSKNNKRYLVCTFCGSRYLADQFLCTNCGNTDPSTLKFLTLEDNPEFRVDYCEKCKHYLKVIDEDKSGRPVPESLEDIITIDLDMIAKDAGLVRI
ncbi:MAG: formate dehydrogenase accessory protein FdhE [Candidatus Methanoperedens sp.]|nr:formate dehydrogenase accessory protein FdhE [Candidatus Methanoperedens sp.]